MNQPALENGFFSANWMWTESKYVKLFIYLLEQAAPGSSGVSIPESIEEVTHHDT